MAGGSGTITRRTTAAREEARLGGGTGLPATPETSALDLHVFRFRLRALGTVRFDSFPGPALRGALGDSPEVSTRLFTPPAALPQKRFADPPRPVTLRPRFDAGVYAPGSQLELDMTLVGGAGAALGALVRALMRLGEQGIGDGRRGHPGAGRFTLERVDAVGPRGVAPVVTSRGLFRPQSFPWRFPHDFDAPGPARGGSVRVEFDSPTFVNRDGETRGDLTFRSVVDDLLRRVSLLAQAYGAGIVYPRESELALLEAAAGVRSRDAALRWREVERFSRRQRSSMTFGGWMGWIEYEGDDFAPWLPLLRAAGLLHVGKHTAFGFGQARLAERFPEEEVQG